MKRKLSMEGHIWRAILDRDAAEAKKFEIPEDCSIPEFLKREPPKGTKP